MHNSIAKSIAITALNNLKWNCEQESNAKQRKNVSAENAAFHDSYLFAVLFDSCIVQAN